MDTIQRSVREYLRAADIVIDLLKNNGALSDQESDLLQAYSTRMQSFSSYEPSNGSNRPRTARAE
jgi:hypothetical protein